MNNKGYARTAEGKLRKWMFWLLAVAVASQFYFVQELITVFTFFAIAFTALAFVVLSVYLLQKGWGFVVVRAFDSERWMARGTTAAIWPAGQDGSRAKSAQDLKTENRNSKDWRGKGSLNWADRENCAERIWGH
jgi:hypothetical protein